jgi:hypothetical protein
MNDKVYFKTTPCKFGHIGAWYHSNHGCVQCIAIRQKNKKSKYINGYKPLTLHLPPVLHQAVQVYADGLLQELLKTQAAAQEQWGLKAPNGVKYGPYPSRNAAVAALTNDRSGTEYERLEAWIAAGWSIEKAE